MATPANRTDDVRIEIKVKNNRLYSAIVAHYPNVHQFCTAAGKQGFKGIRPTTVGKLLNLKMSPFIRDTTEFRSPCLQIERMLKIPAEDLFPFKLYKKLGLNYKAFTFDSSMIRFTPRETTFIEDDREIPPDQAVTDVSLKATVEQVLKTLTYREREVVKLAFGIGDGYVYTNEEIGRIYRVTSLRVKQVLGKAIQKLQHPVRARKLNSFLPDGGGIRLELLPAPTAPEAGAVVAREILDL